MEPCLSSRNSFRFGRKAIGCVVYYGRPEKEVARLKTLQCDVLGIFADQDSGIPPSMVAQFENDMKAAEKTVTVHSFDAQHAFANPSSPRYNQSAAQEANRISLAYLKKKFN